MYPDHARLSAHLQENHATAWSRISEPGEFFTADDRIEMVRVARESLTCSLCLHRRKALSPSAVEGAHDGPENLHPVLVDAIHRLRSDPGRLTRTWFDAVVAEIGEGAYVEMVSVVTSSVIIDTLHNALGLGVPEPLAPKPGKPRGDINRQAVDAGAWVRILAAPDTMADTGLPEVPNIARALGLVPSALDLFFTTFRPHYALKDIPLSISQAQAEFVASRVSALNECFY